MTGLINNIQNNALAALSQMAGSGIMNAIESASVKTGVDFAYLVQQAAAESSFDATAKAVTSSAQGLYQFIESTWVDMVDRYGAKHGINTQGMSDAEILDMRNDPEKASAMAAELAAENQRFLERHYDGEIGATELYFAHFLGAGNAAAFLNARSENGMKEAALIFPAAAKANRAVFYDQTTGRAKSLDEVYAYFDKKFQIEEEINREVATDMAVASYQDPFQDYPEKIKDTKTLSTSTSAERTVRTPSSYSQRESYYSLLSNPIEMTLLTQMLEPPKSAKRNEFQLFSAYTPFK